MMEEGLTEEEACSRIFLMDIGGLVTKSRYNNLPDRHLKFAKVQGYIKMKYQVNQEVGSEDYRFFHVKHRWLTEFKLKRMVADCVLKDASLLGYGRYEEFAGSCADCTTRWNYWLVFTNLFWRCWSSRKRNFEVLLLLRDHSQRRSFRKWPRSIHDQSYLHYQIQRVKPNAQQRMPTE